ncbi:uncharacterized protein PHALS_11445 [Plasmopara halstedii]|uniref:RxLR-like protein n=1 Tax=Plasmopara halstedii TaxID=4781 RepID=A0A0N7L3D5_PLAHL|nr:uncharacterized protein PHALS_11445 [Plasmopara halstedii]CEG35571.1 hypothetical protein PHALS_11445 [Plasmopara halstedii]|eukprot:XP_024571940.1 hypothetical protein PHALS_11445 [Plasmopara halstedii]
MLAPHILAKIAFLALTSTTYNKSIAGKIVLPSGTLKKLLQLALRLNRPHWMCADAHDTNHICL